MDNRQIDAGKLDRRHGGIIRKRKARVKPGTWSAIAFLPAVGRRTAAHDAGTAREAAINYTCLPLKKYLAVPSRNDFIHKLGIVRKELCECLVWLMLISGKHLPSEGILEPIRDESDQLVRIVSASKITAERNARLGKKED